MSQHQSPVVGTQQETVLFHDDFRAGFHHAGPEARWQVRPVGDRPLGDGVARTSADGLVVTPGGTNETTGRPRFAGEPDEVGHLRWAALVDHTTPTGFPGFETVSPGVLVTEAELSARADGLDLHPYGDDVADPRRDLRLAAAALITLDRESGLVFDFMLTDGCVCAVYERLPKPDTDAAVFTYAVPVADRLPDQLHHCEIAYDRDAGRVHWWLDGDEVLVVDRLGRRCLDERHLTRDNGVPDEAAAPRQLATGLGLLADRPWGQGITLAVRRLAVSHR
jgi:hypothetical protein